MTDGLDAPFDLSRAVVGLRRDGRAVRVPNPAGPPVRIDGFTVGAPRMTQPAPHAGEMHPDGDELLYLVSGAITILLELPDGDRTVDLAAGDAMVVPQGTWHRITLREPGQLVHITPGPDGDHRPLGGAPQG